MSSPSPADSFPLGFQVDFDAQYAGIETFTYDVNHTFTSPASPDLSHTFTGLQVSSSPELYSHGLNPPFPFSSPATSETSTFVASPSSTTSNVPSPSPSPPRKTTKAMRTPRKAAYKALPRNLGRVNRSLNAFMLFRRHVISDRKTMLKKIETDHSNLSELVGLMWREKTMKEREPWFAAAAAEKRLHEERHPGYKFAPVVRDRKKCRTRRRGEAEEDRIKELARMINEDRPEEEILATATLHARHIASLSQTVRDERREGKERVAAAPVAEQQIEGSTSNTLVWAPETAELPAVGVVVDVELAAFTEPMMTSMSWPYDISLVCPICISSFCPFSLHNLRMVRPPPTQLTLSTLSTRPSWHICIPKP